MINTEFYRGGAAKIAQTLFWSLNKRNEFGCYFAYGRGEKSNENRTFKFAYLAEIYFQAFLTRFTGLQGYGSWFSKKRLEKYIAKEKFDLIHLHNLHGYYLNLEFVDYLKQLGVPVVWTLHDGWSMTGRCAYLFNCGKWKAGCGNCPDLSLYPKSFIDSTSFMWEKKKEYFSSGWEPTIVCPSKWLADRVRESYLNKHHIKIIPNAVDKEIFKPKDKGAIRKKYNIPLDKKVILFVAADLKDERKGIKYFFESLKYVKSHNYLVLTVGKNIDLPEEIKTEIDVRQLGYIYDKNALSEIYNAADIFCITSIDEVFGLTVTESMACGVPVVGFCVGGIYEQVTEDCGILVKAKDSKSLGESVNKLLNDEEVRRKFNINCRKRVLQNYSISKFTDNYIRLYNEVLKEKKQ